MFDEYDLSWSAATITSPLCIVVFFVSRRMLVSAAGVTVYTYSFSFQNTCCLQIYMETKVDLSQICDYIHGTEEGWYQTYIK